MRVRLATCRVVDSGLLDRDLDLRGGGDDDDDPEGELLECDRRPLLRLLPRWRWLLWRFPDRLRRRPREVLLDRERPRLRLLRLLLLRLLLLRLRLLRLRLDLLLDRLLRLRLRLPLPVRLRLRVRRPRDASSR